ncbi:NrfD/PsrC family molybdoenzyme membrane anchor subunit [Vulgatibacter incomptus]|uniref:Molybdopterin oxidoreductase n=1 Tax=Vulgatibacter incomptus TaxID=1391653 RepID=A0A0K1PA12_9BACT|nr:NrfD/PsrC family molybdoenzyme membrane anchor subunit [Vulgatibacter incomptus]AKU90251.1 Molybdopterin oxidoreductase [Vulgatibacter incomptus]
MEPAEKLPRESADYAKAMDGPPILLTRESEAAITRRLLRPIFQGGPGWKLAFLITLGGSTVCWLAILYTVATGIGTWGTNIPVAWAYAITNFVWWIGIGHAGTFISAILLILEQTWRNSINRFAEAMTLFAIMQAAIFPVLHLGRPWYAYWILPYPATMRVWPNYRSALPWDAAAISTYFTVSLIFWYLGLIPDLAAARDSAPTLGKRRWYGIFALGWRGSARDWKHYQIAYLILGALATPLVLSVHSVVSLDFAIAQLPGWHSTIFPPYFVAGAIYSGFAMVLTLMIPVRRIFRLHDVITTRHLEAMGKLVLVTGSIVYYTYAVETFLAWYSGSEYEYSAVVIQRLTGPFAWTVWTVYSLNFLCPNLMWFKRIRQSAIWLFFISILVNIAMWLERFEIIVTSLSRDFLPSSWHFYKPTYIDGAIIIGTLFFFMFLFLCFLRWVPFIPISETKEVRHLIVSEERRLAEERHATGRGR